MLSNGFVSLESVVMTGRGLVERLTWEAAARVVEGERVVKCEDCGAEGSAEAFYCEIGIFLCDACAGGCDETAEEAAAAADRLATRREMSAEELAVCEDLAAADHMARARGEYPGRGRDAEERGAREAEGRAAAFRAYGKCVDCQTEPSNWAGLCWGCMPKDSRSAAQRHLDAIEGWADGLDTDWA